MLMRPGSPAAIHGKTGVFRPVGLTRNGLVQCAPPSVDEANMTLPPPGAMPSSLIGYSAHDMYRFPVVSMATTTNASMATLGSATRTCTSCQSGLTDVTGVAGCEHASATVAAVFGPDAGPRQYEMTAASPASLLCAT